MAAHVGTIDLKTRVLLAVGDGEEDAGSPPSRSTCPPAHAAHEAGVDITFDSRRWRRHLALGFLRMAWAVWTSRDEQA